MKNCPKCGAQIDDSARFCLYCMTSFDKKDTITHKKNNKSGTILISIVLIAVMISVLCVFAFAGRTDKDKNFSSIPVEDVSDNISSDTLVDSSSNSAETVSKGESSVAADIGADKISSKVSAAVVPSSSSPAVSAPSSAPNTSSAQAPSADTTAKITYIYRDSVPADDELSVFSDPTGYITIIGVKTVAADGVYVIPSEIDGKKVFAIDGATFQDDSIKNTVIKVIVPETVRSINNLAFFNCYNLTDIYIRSESVCICSAYAFPDARYNKNTITLHASATAHNRDFRKLSLVAEYNGLEFKEWNGGDIS